MYSLLKNHLYNDIVTLMESLYFDIIKYRLTVTLSFPANIIICVSNILLRK